MKKMIAFFLVITAPIVYMMGCDEAGVLGTEVRETEQGKIIGQRYVLNGEESMRYLGIPYAKPPVGDLRFRPPQDPEPFEDGEFEAFDFAPECLQKSSITGRITGCEDCLYLNVWTPVNAEPGDDLPVMVFVHGGGNDIGSSEETIRHFLGMAKDTAADEEVSEAIDSIKSPFLDTPIYQGNHFADKYSIILVTINYRLGALGHLAHPSVGRGSGNFTYLDIVKALQWVNRSIENFGGDKDNVTLFGQSAGAWNTCALLNMPEARGLFHKAIMESQACLSRTLEQAEEWGEYYVKNAGCDGSDDVATCLRDADAESFFKENIWTKPSGFMPCIPAVDGDVIPEHFAESIKTDAFNHVPVIIGNNENELVVSIATDIGFNCQLDANLAIFADNLQAPLYQYRFGHHPLSNWVPVIHTFELPYVFGTAAEMFNNSGRETEVADIVGAYWASFARSGDPNENGRQYWPEYDRESQRYLRLNAAPSEEEGCVIFNECTCYLSEVLISEIMGEQIVFW